MTNAELAIRDYLTALFENGLKKGGFGYICTFAWMVRVNISWDNRNPNSESGIMNGGRSHARNIRVHALVGEDAEVP